MFAPMIEIRISAKGQDDLRDQVADAAEMIGAQTSLGDFPLADVIEYARRRLNDLGLDLEVTGGTIPEGVD
jgi:hypothetical protein